MANVLVTQHIGDEGVGKLREAGHTVIYRDDTESMSPDELQTAVKKVEGLVCLLTDRVDTAVTNLLAGLAGQKPLSALNAEIMGQADE